MGYETRTGVKCVAEGGKRLVPVAATPVHAMTASRWGSSSEQQEHHLKPQALEQFPDPVLTSTTWCGWGITTPPLSSADAWEFNLGEQVRDGGLPQHTLPYSRKDVLPQPSRHMDGIACVPYVLPRTCQNSDTSFDVSDPDWIKC